MIEVTRTQLLPGVHLTAVQTQKFKSSVLGMQFLLPLAREQAALHALLPMVLRRGTAEHPDMESLSAVLDELYGGSLEPTVRKKGETQCVGFVGSFLDDAYTLDGSAPLERVRAAVQAIVDGLPAGERAPLARPEKGNAPAQPRRVEEALDVTQGKLAMGFRTCIDAWDEDYPALMLLNAVYGGTTTSKLFLNVRERLSLCYYASSGLMKYKDVMLVSSGVEFSKVGQAQDEILAQLQACKDGGFTDDELEWARRSVVSTLMTTLDAQSRLEDYWLGQAAAGLTEAPDELAQRVERTTRAQVQAAAQKLTLDTVYFLKGKE